jgi:septum site-determining protein MinD
VAQRLVGLDPGQRLAYGCPVAAVLPHSDDLMILSSEGVFSLRYPEHRLTHLYQDIAAKLVP